MKSKMIMGRNRMLARARGKYGKPEYPGREAEKKHISVCSENAERIWHKVMEVMEGEVARISLETWLQPCKVLRLEDNKLMIAAENALAKELLEKRYLPHINVVAKKVAGEEIKVMVASER